MKLNTLDELDIQFKKSGFNIWSTSPQFNYSLYPSWYKNNNLDIISIYKKSYVNILGPNLVNALIHAKDIVEDLSMALLLPINDDWFSYIEKIISRLSKVSSLKNDLFTGLIIDLLKSFLKKDLNQIRTIYKNNEVLNLWGMSNIIVALRKDFK